MFLEDDVCCGLVFFCDVDYLYGDVEYEEWLLFWCDIVFLLFVVVGVMLLVGYVFEWFGLLVLVFVF